MRRFIKILLILFVAIIVLAIAVPLLVPAERFKEPALREIETLTGRKVTIEKISLSLLPNIALKAENVTLANPDWAGNEPMAEIKTLRLGVELMPLLKGEVRLQQLVLESPHIMLIKQGDKINWQFTPVSKATAEAQPIKPTKAKKLVSDEDAPSLPTFGGEIIVRDGRVTYKDGNRIQSLDKVTLDINTSFTGKFTIDASTVYNDAKTSLSFAIDDYPAALKGTASAADLAFDYGSLSAKWKGKLALKKNQPEITGAITTGTIDMATLKAMGDKEDGERSSSGKPAAASSSGRWSDTPVDLSFLGNGNGDLSLHIDALKLPKTTLNDINTTIKLQNGVLSTMVKDLQAYGGTLNLAFSASSAHAISFSFSAEKVKAESLLHDFMDMDTVDGTMSEHITGSTSGASERAWVSNLQGKGDFEIKDGSIRGKDVLAMAKGVTSAFQDKGGNSTVFSLLDGTYTIKTGVLSNSDLKMQSSLVTVGGSGTVDLPNWRVNYLLKPVLASAVTVPMRVEGPLDHPSYRPDVGAALLENLTNPPLVKDATKEIQKNLLNKNSLQNLLR